MPSAIRVASNKWTWIVATATIVVLMVATMVYVANRPESTGAECDSAAAADVAAAASLARDCDIEVEVDDERTPWTTTYATPDGTMRLDMHARATGTNIHGEWEDIDTSIERSPSEEGLLAVAAPIFELGLSGGDAATERRPLGVIEKDGHRFEVGFPLPLPEPEVTPKRAVYELAEGVRVVTWVMVDGTGFTPVIELDSPEAAAWFEAALTEARDAQGLPGAGLQVPFTLSVSEGLSVTPIDGGAVEVTDAEGETVFQAPPPLMWDATGWVPRDAEEGEGEQRGASDTTLTGDKPGGDEVRAGFPWPGDHVVSMATDLVGDTLLVSPDSSLLSSASTTWPVRIDPGFSGRGASEWTMLRTGGFSSSIYKWTDLSSTYRGGGVGRCVGSACGTSYYVSRLVWEYSGMSAISAMSGSDIVSAQFRVYGESSNSCTAARTDLHMTGAISSSSTWNSVSFLAKNDTRLEAHRSGCPSGPGWREFNATAALKYFADHNLSTITLGLKANNESNMSGWKRFLNNATLSVTYNRAPNKATNVKFISPSVPCVQGSSRPYIATTRPSFSAKVTDPDGGTLKPAFQVYVVSPLSEAVRERPSAKSGKTVSWTVPPGKLVNGETYGFRVQNYDGARKSTWSAVCEFTVDTEKPVTPAVSTVGGSSVQAIYFEGRERGGVGLKGMFTLSRRSSEDVAQFQYGFNAPTMPHTTTPDSNGKAKVSFTPTTTGPVTLYVRTRDRAGNLSSTKQYSFDVGTPKEDAIWMLDEGSGSWAQDTGGVSPEKPLEVSGATWVKGPHALFNSRKSDRALAFDGSNDLAHSAPTVRTDEAFSLSAYVWLDADRIDTGHDFTALSQSAVRQSGFEIGYRSSCPETGGSGGAGCWAFGMDDADSDNSGETVVRSSVPVTGDQWVHLVAEHNPNSHTMRFWVCEIGSPNDPAAGEPVRSSVSRTATPWHASGAFILGRGRHNGGSSGWWPGRIDNVRVFSGQVMAESKIRRMCQGAEATDFGGDLDQLDPTVEEGQ